MNGGAPDFEKYFRLKPTRAAKVSEISETTASASVAPEERVNFHIGNPVQDARLSSAYLRAALGADIRDESLTEENADALLRTLDWSEADRQAIGFFSQLVRRSAPYLPRGGFTRTAPSPLAVTFANWLQNQQEPLVYDPGKTSGHREIIFSSGGIAESLRVFFHALSGFLAETPARVFLFNAPLPLHVLSFAGLRFQTLPDEELASLESLSGFLKADPPSPTFIVLGSVTSEETRRSLRLLSLEHPIFFVEINDAPNHLSMAREAKLIDRVVRFLTPAIFSPRFRELSLVFVAGNAEYLNLLETFHFQLKGTPSASEVELLTYLLDHPPSESNERPEIATLPVEPPLEAPGYPTGAEAALAAHALRLEQLVTSALADHAGIVSDLSASIRTRAREIISKPRRMARLEGVDRFAGLDAADLLRGLAANIGDREWLDDLCSSFLGAFTRHHPEYDPSSCTVVSGSSRTALSLLGFHCGIREVVIPDLSWTYEHCFPSVSTVPLTPEFGIDTAGILSAVEAKIGADPAWAGFGAVVLNNPHNATGRVFDIAGVRDLLHRLLSRGVTVIDDLSYQNVAPVDALPEIPTLKQLADELVRTGSISSSDAARVITVHSLSKTDCLAGARLSVVEIPDSRLLERFRSLYATVRPNIGAILLAYLFYRNPLEVARAYWRLRNSIFRDRMDAIASALKNLPAERNPFDIRILPPTGSMYPLMVIDRLPAGLSLDWGASRLARQGIGMVPLSTFARTEKGFETGRKAFRLTLGGTDGAPALLKKTRRVLIDLNRLVHEESAQYQRNTFSIVRRAEPPGNLRLRWDAAQTGIVSRLQILLRSHDAGPQDVLRDPRTVRLLTDQYVPERLEVYRQRLFDRALIIQEFSASARADGGKNLAKILEQEFYKDNLVRRQALFQGRLFDRTVHPTQMFSIRAEAALKAVIDDVLREQTPGAANLNAAAKALVEEFLGTNVAITSSDESDEVILDLNSHIAAELFGELQGAELPRTFLSFWGDWDGSTRPSGQGHRLLASVLVENVRRLSTLIIHLAATGASARIRPDLLSEIERLPGRNTRFVNIFNEITSLTHQLERRYRGILPFHAKPGRIRQIGMALHLARDPVTSLWYHNDRLERKMLDLRRRRKEGLEYYFGLNKRLRKELHGLIPALQQSLGHPALLREAVLYRDLLQRFLITPRIHQNMVTAQDPFAIDPTVFNIMEINEIGSRFGNPGMALALQVSMSTKPEALIDLDRRMRARREHLLRDRQDPDLPSIWLIPLFEDQAAVAGMTGYINKLWEYALQSRRLNQETRDRFAEMISELFIAGSDLSQQLSQSAGAHLFREAKYQLFHWLADHGLAERIRLKMGSGEPMQRQGGYYSEASGMPAFVGSSQAELRFSAHLRESTRRSTVYATTPMLGIFSSGDLRTLQSAIAERVRYLSAGEFAQLLHHVARSQKGHRRDLIRACEVLADSRLKTTLRGEQALERLTVGAREKAFEDFLKVLTENFRQILYGREEDVVGIHVVSYFIARTTPPLRDRPTVRAGQGGKGKGDRILERIAETIPFSRYGSLLRAIAHNQAQTSVLGINQLTTGLFRALDTFSRQESVEGDPETFLADRILPHLPVYEILQSLRLYHDVELRNLHAIERAFPAGNSALLALREDLDAMTRYIPLFQQELLRRHGIDVSDFFEGNRFIPHLLPTLRPDLVVLLQPDLFNTDLTSLQEQMGGFLDRPWLDAVARQLNAREQIRRWRTEAWTLLEKPVYQRVESFVELAVSLYSISSKNLSPELPTPARNLRLPSRLDSFFRMSRTDDEMRQFLAAATEYLTIASEGMVEVPANIIRAMKEVERIAKIEEQALSPKQQSQLRFYLLQIARLAGENG